MALLEASDRPGGRIRTLRRDSFLLEEGPDAFLTAKEAGLRLAGELDLKPIPVEPAARRSFVVRAGRLVPVPEGFYLMAPASLGALIRAPLFTWRGKLRMAMEPFVPAGSAEDESVGSFVRRRLGREALERFAQPMLSGIYTADPEMLSLRATFPQFLEMERRGGVIRGLRHLPRDTSGARYGLFASFAGGMQELVDALVARLPEGCLRLGRRVAAVAPGKGGWKVICADGEALAADALCLAMPLRAAGALVADLATESVSYADCAVVNLGFRRGQVGHPLDGAGLVVPAVERLSLLSVSFSSRKFPGRAPEGHVLLRAFAGGALSPDVYAMDDAALAAAILVDLRRLLDLRGEPVLQEVARHPASMPQYAPGHLALIERLEARLRRHPGLALAGGHAHGAGIPDCIASGEAAAHHLTRRAASAIPPA